MAPIANGLTLTACPGCADSIQIKTLGVDGTHVIIDVMGYFSPATFNSSTVTRLAGAATGAVRTGLARPPPARRVQPARR